MSIILFNKSYSKDIKILDLSLSQIKEISNELQIFARLTALTLSGNFIEIIPDFLCNNFPNLNHLYLTHNYIKNIPDSIGNLISLQTLHIYHNEISNIPIPIINLIHLTKFDYSNNPIEYISPIVQRFLDKIENKGNCKKNIYSDSQNVHVRSIQKSVRDSIVKILANKN